ncbi:MAG: hypothetical protein WA139_01855 [Candidatus Aenigmatarchaeota archaeon]
MTNNSRRYPPSDVKILWGLAAGRCSFPGCKQPCICEASDIDPSAPIGKISHIEAHSNNGPRVNLNLTRDERDCYNNWILLCGKHHDTVDAQPNTYTSDNLREWKKEHEKWVNDRLLIAIPSIGFLELEMVASAMMSVPGKPTIDLMLVPPREKMNRNGLSDKILNRMFLGLVKSKEVGEFLESMAIIKPDFPEKLKGGFVSAYMKMKNEDGLRGDALFLALHDFASAQSIDFDKQAAGLAVLVHLFEKCEVFEK